MERDEADDTYHFYSIVPILISGQENTSPEQEDNSPFPRLMNPDGPSRPLVIGAIWIAGRLWPAHPNDLCIAQVNKTGSVLVWRDYQGPDLDLEKCEKTMFTVAEGWHSSLEASLHLNTKEWFDGVEFTVSDPRTRPIDIWCMTNDIGGNNNTDCDIKSYSISWFQLTRMAGWLMVTVSIGWRKMKTARYVFVKQTEWALAEWQGIKHFQAPVDAE
ncbi:hypothetical protein DL546_002903 [Coniochaeta pulveracea]|uniref:Uncharacterized protein n=1 Tax=Coniochaeta pulveracea TaxID=177199 RepID=A0A420XZZ0_9PEZI|nr:hypothetical protein DL546_002903 [Coniochaeta pulveracea]